MGFFNKLEDETKRILSQTDDFVNEEIPGGWYTVAALAAGGAGYGMNGGTGAETGAGGGGFSFLPSGEMTVFSPETVGATGGTTGGTNFLSSLFGSSGELAPMNPTDYSRAVEMYPTSSGNIFEPSGMSPSQISSIQNMGDQALLSDQLASRQRMPDFGQQSQQETAKQLAQLNQGGESGGMRKGQKIPVSLLASLLDPQNAVKAYRPTLL